MSADALAIIGIAARLPDAPTLDDFLENLANRRDSVKPLSEARRRATGLPVGDYRIGGYLEDIDLFDHRFFGLSKREADFMDPQQRLLMQLSICAIEDAALRPSALAGSRCAVIACIGTAEYLRLLAERDPTETTGNHPAMAAGRIAHALDLRGGAFGIDSGCSASLVALHQARLLLQAGEADTVLVGAARLMLTPPPGRIDGDPGILSADGKARAFDAQAAGTAVGEGAVALLLKPLGRALSDGDPIHAVLLGTAINQNGGRSAGMAAPSPLAQTEVVRQAWRQAGVSGADLGFIEAHGTATRLGDPIEVQGLTDAFSADTGRRRDCELSSVKSNIGHLDCAAGLAGVAKAVLSVREGRIFPSVHLHRPNPLIDFESTALLPTSEAREWIGPKPRTAGVSAFSLNGTNAHAVLREPPLLAGPVVEPTGPFVVPVSAQSTGALATAISTLRAFLLRRRPSLGDVARTLREGRETGAVRALFVASDLDDLIEQLSRATVLPASGRSASLVLLASGAPKETLASLLASLSRHPRALAHAQAAVAPFQDLPPWRRVEAFRVQLALASALRAVGLTASLVLGYGAGRLVSQHLSGRLDAAGVHAALTEPEPPITPLDEARVSEAVRPLRRAGDVLFLELGREGALADVVMRCASVPSPALGDHPDLLLTAAARAWTAGLPVDLSALDGSSSSRRIHLPGGTFEPVRCWARLRRDAPATALTRQVPDIPALDSDTPGIVRRVFAEVLGLLSVDDHDEFFALGGNSLIATRLVTRLAEALGRAVTIEQLFDAPTVGQLASQLSGQAEASVGDVGPDGDHMLPAVTNQRPLQRPLSSAQERLHFLESLGAAGSGYVITESYRLDGELDTVAFAASVGDVVARHEVLRARFIEVNADVVQCVEDASEPVLVPEVGDEAKARLRVRELAGRPFDLARQPPLRLALMTIGPAEHVFAFCAHHIAWDGASLGVFLGEVIEAYEARSSGRVPSLRPLPWQYGDYAARQRERIARGDFQISLDYWVHSLRDAPAVLELPFDHPRPRAMALPVALQPFVVPAEVTRRLAEVARDQRASLFMVLLAAFKALLWLWTGQRDLVVATPVANRGDPRNEGLIGLFVNTLALRADLTGNPSFVELIARVRRTTLDGLAHQELPFDKVVEALNPPRDLSRQPVSQVMFAFQESVKAGTSVLRFAPFESVAASAKFDLVCSMSLPGNQLEGQLEVPAGLLDPQNLRRLAIRLVELLGVLSTTPSSRASSWPATSSEELALLIVDWNDVPGQKGSGLLHLHFRDQARRTPDAVAVVDGDRRLSYRELDLLSDTFAARLAARLDAPDRAEPVVGVALQRSADTVVCLLAILKSGAVYLPLDVEHPAERLSQMVRDAGACLLLSDGTVSIDADVPVATPASLLAPAPLPPPQLPQDDYPGADSRIAYIVYTSGSTGTPKGVAVPHSAASNLAVSRLAHDPIGPGDRILAAISVGFDVSIGQLLLPLLSGATVVIAPQLRQLAPEDFWALLARDGVTHINGGPSFFDAMIDTLLRGPQPRRHRGLRQLMLGGEPLTPMLIARLRDALPGTRFANMYGPTEACIDATVYCVPEGTLGPLIPIGRPLPGYRCYVLDDAGRPAAVGSAGELHLAGAGLARGYVGRPSETAARFVPDPFGPPGSRMYRTGDRARWRADGQLEFLGRDDGQVKIRGFRVETGEIEAALRQLPGVLQAVVVPYRSRGEGTDLRLCAYLVGSPVFADIRAELSRTLPYYMVPDCIMRVDALPLNENNKLDRSALPEPYESFQTEAGSNTSQLTVTQTLLAQLWRPLLEIDRVGPETDFFAAGGHSLLASRLVSRVRESFGVDLMLRDVFATPRLGALAQRLIELRAGPRAATIVPRVPASPLVPATSAQSRLWFLDSYDRGSTAYNIPAAWRIRAAIDADVLEQALQRLVARHEALRTTFRVEGNGVIQVVAGALRVPLARHKLLPEPEAVSQAVELLREEASTPFDLARGPLLRARLLCLAPNDHIVALTVHHIIADGWSMGLLSKELGALYDEIATGGDALPPVVVQYPDVAAWSGREAEQTRLAAQLSWWLARLKDAPTAIELPIDHPRPARLTYRGDTLEFSVDGHAAEGLRAVCRTLGATPFMAFATAFSALLHRMGAGDDLCIGYPTAGRHRTETEGTVGLFVNTLVLRTRVSTDDRLTDVLERVREHTLEADANSELPFERLVEALAPQRTLDRPPLVQVMLSFDNNEARTWRIGGHEAVFAGGRNDTAKFEVQLQVSEDASGFRCAFQYRADLFERVTISRFADRLKRLLCQLATDANCRVGEIEVLDETEHALLAAWSGRAPAAGDAPVRPCHELFEAAVTRSPDAIAVLCGERSWCYKELNAAANRLAHHLRGFGVGPDRLVGVCLAPGVDLAVALLAVLKAGGAYLPLDPELPEARLAALVCNARAVAVVTCATIAPAFQRSDGPVVVLVDEHCAAIACKPAENLELISRPDDLAYCIYTSGSTGRPKGALNHHAGLSRLLYWFMSPATGTRRGAERVLLASALGFDLTQKNLLGPLCFGETLVMPDGPTTRWAALAEAAALHRPTRINCAPSVYKSLRDLPPITAIPTVILGGETVDDALARALSEMGHTLINGYGPSECSAVAAFHRQIPGRMRTPVPIGRPLPHATVHVLDVKSRRVPIGVVGEICIGGGGVSRGYAGEADVTATAFVPDPFGPPGSRLYRTGDLGRWLTDGVLQFVGRSDRQVKLRGVRIEPGEVEAALAACPGVRDSAVVVRDERLVAYIVSMLDERSTPASPSRLSECLSQSLPPYLVPSAYVFLDSLPLNANGKLDVSSLPEPSSEPVAARPPEGEVEPRVAALFAELTGRMVEDAENDFFLLGGHSLLAARLAFRLEESFGVKVSLRRLFENSTVSALARHIEAQILNEIDALPEDAVRAILTD